MLLAASAGADEPARKYEVVSPKDDGIIATGINRRGEVIGFEWVEEKETPGVISQMPFLAKGKSMTRVPLLAGYTATFPAGLSDDGLVVGRVSKAAAPGVRVHLRNQAFLWDARNGIRGLGALKDDAASFASGVSSDGRLISGFSVGPDRVRACVWQRDGEGWLGMAMPHEFQLGSNTVAISNDGKNVTAVDGVVACLWSREGSGPWTRRVIAEPAALVPRAVNNAGTVVGLRYTPDGNTHAIVWSRDAGLKVLDEPEGYVKAEANAINNEGVVVGLIDGPNGSKTGPNAFVYERGKMRVMTEGGPAFTSATAINDRGQVAGVLEKDDEEEAKPLP
jgi:uncharacterized membrane protein